ncbi:MAG: MFS transporter [Candidatus Nanopelagicales bacterium]
MTKPAPAPKIVRTSLTWTMYAVAGVSAFFLYAVGPATALIAEDLGISASQAALHGTAVALAMISTGALAPLVIGRFGRASGLVLVLVVVIVGVAMVAAAPALWVSLIGAYLAGCGSQVAGVIGNATLTDAHPENPAAVLTESNGAAAWSGLLAPLLMGLFLSVGLGWRVGLAVAIPMCLVMIVAVRRGMPAIREHEPPDIVEVGDVAAPSGPGGPPTGAERIPRAFWWVMAAVFAAAGVEFGVNFWGATLMLEQISSNKALVTSLMSAPVAGVAIGRTFGSALTARFIPHQLLVGGFALSVAGFFVFWSSRIILQAGAGLLLLGLGISVLFPLLLDRAVGYRPAHKDKALAMCVAFAGTAIGSAPYVLGEIGERTGTSAAFLIVPGLSLLGLAAVVRSRPRNRVSE